MMPARPMPEPAAGLGEGGERDGIAGLGRGEDRIDGVVAALRRPTGAAQQRARPDLGLPAADRPAATRQAVRVDRDVPDLAAVAGRAGQRLAVDDEAAADADRAPDEDDVVDAAGRAAAMLRERRQVGLVGERDRDVRSEGLGQVLAERLVAPAEVRRHRHHAVAPADDADDARRRRRRCVRRRAVDRGP